MGTRSLLAVETAKDKLHVQYMQFDGYPSCKGYEYYTAILFSIMEAGAGRFFTKAGKPNKMFRDRCVNFLNNYQYKTHHSTDNHWIANKKTEWDFQTDTWQEFEYLFDKEGTFIIQGHGLSYEIPWEITMGLAKGFFGRHSLNVKRGCIDDNAENLFTTLFNQLDRTEDEEEVEIQPLIIDFESGQKHICPDQGKVGWRDYAIVRLKDGKKNVLTIKSSTAMRKGEKRNVVKLKSFGERG